MKWYILLGSVVLLGCVGHSDACPPVAFARSTYYAAPTYTAYQAPVVAVPVAIPLYFVQYQGSGDAAFAAALNGLRQEMAAMKAQLQQQPISPFQAQRQQGQPPPMPGATDPAPAAAPLAAGPVYQHCAKCHSGAAAKGVVTLSDKTKVPVRFFDDRGQRVQVPGEVLGDAVRTVLEKRMPPPSDHKLTPLDSLAVLDDLTK